MHEVGHFFWSEGLDELGVFLHEQAVPADVGDGEFVGGGGGEVEAFDDAFDDAEALVFVYVCV
jgi:hypothetical protein